MNLVVPIQAGYAQIEAEIQVVVLREKLRKLGRDQSDGAAVRALGLDLRHLAQLERDDAVMVPEAQVARHHALARIGQGAGLKGQRLLNLKAQPRALDGRVGNVGADVVHAVLHALELIPQTHLLFEVTARARQRLDLAHGGAAAAPTVGQAGMDEPVVAQFFLRGQRGVDGKKAAISALDQRAVDAKAKVEPVIERVQVVHPKQIE